MELSTSPSQAVTFPPQKRIYQIFKNLLLVKSIKIGDSWTLQECTAAP